MAQYVDFTELADSFGIEYTFIDPQDYGTGITLFDINQDGKDDLSFGAFEDESLHFYLAGDSTFIPTEFPGIEISNYRSKCLMWVDFDNDSDLDLSVTTIEGPLFLFQNNGDFSFSDISDISGIGNRDLNAYASCWGDYDKDGDLDFYVVNRETSTFGSRNRLFQNQGDGTFEDVTSLSGVYDSQGYGYAVTFIDYNKDGWPDLYIANDKAISENTLFKNLGNGKFLNVSDPLTTGIRMDGMGIGVGDFDKNGYEDMYLTNTAQSSPDFGGNVFLINNGDTTFTDIAEQENMQVFSTSWGTNMADFNNDGLLDLYVSNEGPTDEYRRNRMFIQQPDMHFLEDTLSSQFTTYKRSFSSTIGDINNDGYYDIAVLNTAGDNLSLWQNNGGENNWIKVHLEGSVSNKDGIGSWITAYYNGNISRVYTRCGSSFGAQSSANYIIGVGNSTSIDSVSIQWPSSDLVNTYYDLPVQQSYYWLEHDNDTTITDTTSVDTTVTSTFLQNDFGQFAFSIYPNPSEGKFQIKLPDLVGEVHVEILDSKGQLIDQFKWENVSQIENHIFNLNHYPPNMYFIKVKNLDISSVKRWIKY